MQKEIVVPPLKVFFDKKMREKILQDLDKVLTSGMVASGPKTEEFEKFWADYCGAKYAIACSNGGSALELIFRYLNVKNKDVLVPTNTFIATVNAIIAAGGNPVFLDADYKTLCINLDEIQRKKTPNTVAVCIVHIGGLMTAELPDIVEYCKKEGLYFVEDAAHAHGSEFQGQRAGKYGIAAAYSFFVTKVVTSGEGGMVVTDNEDLSNFVKTNRDYGKKSQWESIHTAISMNYRMSEIAAIIGLAQARKLDEFIPYRNGIAKKYIDVFKGKFELVLPQGRNSWYKFILYLPKGVDRNMLKSILKEHGIGLSGGVYDVPLHLQPVFEHLNLKGKFSVAEDVCTRHVCLPIFYGMTPKQVDYVISNIETLMGRG